MAASGLTCVMWDIPLHCMDSPIKAWAQLHQAMWSLRLSFQLPECSSLELRELHPGVGRLDSLCTPGKAPPLGLPLLPACSPTTSALQCLHWTRMQFIKGLSAHTVLGGPSDPWHGFPRTLNTEACKRTWKGLGNLFCQWVPSW